MISSELLKEGNNENFPESDYIYFGPIKIALCCLLNIKIKLITITENISI